VPLSGTDEIFYNKCITQWIDTMSRA